MGQQASSRHRMDRWRVRGGSEPKLGTPVQVKEGDDSD